MPSRRSTRKQSRRQRGGFLDWLFGSSNATPALPNANKKENGFFQGVQDAAAEVVQGTQNAVSGAVEGVQNAAAGLMPASNAPTMGGKRKSRKSRKTRKSRKSRKTHRKNMTGGKRRKAHRKSHRKGHRKGHRKTRKGSKGSRKH